MALWTAARHRVITASVLVAACAALLSGASARAQDSVEYTVKAAYLYKFGDYVEWPAAAFESPTSPVNLCIGGDDPFGVNLDKTVTGEKIQGRPIAVQRLKIVERNSSCHILYVSGSPQQGVAQALEAVRGAPVLTVTDAARGTDAIGIVHFIKQANRVRFDIDDDAAEDNKLTISSKLFSIAASVKPRK